MTEPTIIYTEPICGKCPVQAEGTINGQEFYFRSRGEHWRLYIAPKAGGGVWSVHAWIHSEIYPGCIDEEAHDFHGIKVKYAAGHAEPEECKQFIERAAKLWLEAQNKS